MKTDSIKIIIAGVLVVIAATALTGCVPDKSKSTASEVGAERIALAREMKKSVGLSLVEVEGEAEGEIVTRLMLNNPEEKPITSVQAWLTYNPDVLTGISIDTQKTAFSLMAPYDNNFDNEAGLVMLGRSSAEPVTDKEITVANIHFRRISDGAAMIEAYDFRQDLTGHTSANMMLDGVPINILLKPQTPLLILESSDNSL